VLQHCQALRSEPRAQHYVPHELARAHSQVRVLIVNEDLRSAASLKQTLLELGYPTTRTAYSARRALRVAGEFAPTFALLDLELPDMSGYQLASMLRTHEARGVRQLPLIAVAERSAFGCDDLARAAGFAGYLIKPIRAWMLDDVLRTLER
jgi:CheY-like chemotaxis protein